MAQKQESSTLKANEPSRPQFYRRKLPETCISFSSDEGKKIFREALTSGHMDCYFKVAAQFRTQDEPAFCGLSTLVMVLNALEIDPEKVWKGPWRWYHENMLDCCVPVKVIEQEGITFGQFICLAECNGLESTATYIDENASLQLFRNDIIRYTKQDDSLITLTYSRKVLKQTGDGHFSPVAGYHPDRDLVLMMDTARFKYPPHWIPLPLLFEAMQAKDKTTGKSRGYVVMKKQTQSGLLLFRISGSFGVTLKNACSESMGNMLNAWKAWLCQSIDNSGSVEKVIGSAIEGLLKSSCLVPAGQLIFTTQLDLKCSYDLSDQHFCVIKSLIMELEKNTIFEIVSEALRNKTSNFNLDMFGNLSVATSISRGEPAENKCKRRCLQDLQPSHFLAMFVLSWPYHSVAIKHDTNAFVLNEYVCKIMTSVDTKYLGNEVRTLRKQFTALLVSFNECCGNTCSGSCG